MSLRLAFMGTPDFAVPTLAELLGQGQEIACVYTQPPRPKGRGLTEEASPVQKFAAAAGMEVRTPASLKSAEEQKAFAALKLDAAVVVAYGLILPKPILASPRLGCFNLHASLLPRWRGAAPIQRAIMAGDAETGVMVMHMDEGLDTGPVLMAERVAIGRKTYGQLHDELARLGAGLMGRALSALEHGMAQEQPQASEGITYAKKIAQGRNPHRLEEIRARPRLPGARGFARTWRLVRGQRRTHQGALCRASRGQRGARRRAERSHHRLR